MTPKETIAAEALHQIFDSSTIHVAPQPSADEAALKEELKRIIFYAMELYATTDDCATWREQMHANAADMYREHACDANRRAVMLCKELYTLGYSHEQVAEIMNRGKKDAAGASSDDMAMAAQTGSTGSDS